MWFKEFSILSLMAILFGGAELFWVILVEGFIRNICVCFY